MKQKNKDVFELFCKKFKYICTRNVSLKSLTTFRIGGNVSVLCEPKSKRQLRRVVKYACRLNIAYEIIGNGSNILGADSGFCGIIIKLGGRFKQCVISRKNVVFGAAVNLFVGCNFLCAKSLCGLEFLYGIPGTFGGAAAMNAGAFGQEIAERILWVEAYLGGRFKKISKKDCNFSYRNSIFIEKNLIITRICLKLNYGKPQDIKSKHIEYFIQRKKTQPYSSMSAGSVFKRNGQFVPAKAIDHMGLKGKSVNDAQVSKIHAGFIVNLGHATCQDVLDLISLIRKDVYEKYGQQLNLEIKLIGEQK